MGNILVVFGYTTAMATEWYPKVWVSNKTVVRMFLSGMLMEIVMVLYVQKDEEVDIVFKFNRMGGLSNLWYWGFWCGFLVCLFACFSEEALGIAVQYSYDTWLVIVIGWSLLIGVRVIM